MSQLHCRFSTNMQLLHLLQLIRFCCMFIPKKYFFFGSAKPAFLELLLIGNTMILYLGGQCNSIISYHIMFLNKDFYHNVIPLIMQDSNFHFRTRIPCLNPVTFPFNNYHISSTTRQGFFEKPKQGSQAPPCIHIAVWYPNTGPFLFAFA